jgi:hypothetical protein
MEAQEFILLRLCFCTGSSVPNSERIIPGARWESKVVQVDGL